jgi:hypothetical protein
LLLLVVLLVLLRLLPPVVVVKVVVVSVSCLWVGGGGGGWGDDLSSPRSRRTLAPGGHSALRLSEGGVTRAPVRHQLRYAAWSMRSTSSASSQRSSAN